MNTCTFEDGGKGMLRHVVVHGIMERNGELLLVKRAGPILETGKWSLPSGFLGRDETAAGGIVREIKEETGWDSEVIALFRVNTNPHRPNEDRQNVAFDFLLRPIKEAGSRDSENSKVEWMPIDKLLSFDQYAFDHGEFIKKYLEYRKNPFPLPLLI